VDWDRRRELLRQVKAGDASERKLWLIERLLALRARRPETFATGSYEPLDAGPSMCAFVRGGQVLVTVPLREGAGKLDLPTGEWADAASIDVLGFTIFERAGR
jgi:maltooligosyltrehalose synthase